MYIGFLKRLEVSAVNEEREYQSLIVNKFDHTYLVNGSQFNKADKTIRIKKYASVQSVHSHRKIPDPKCHSETENKVLKNKSWNGKEISEIFTALST
jgi:uncharacterized protein YjcR